MEFSNYFFSQNSQVSGNSKQTAEKEQVAIRVMRVHCAPAELKRPLALLPQTSPGSLGPDTAPRL